MSGEKGVNVDNMCHFCVYPVDIAKLRSCDFEMGRWKRILKLLRRIHPQEILHERQIHEDSCSW